jgi:hypothetical protein
LGKSISRMLANSPIVEDWKTAVNHQSDMEYGKESWGTDLTDTTSTVRESH